MKDRRLLPLLIPGSSLSLKTAKAKYSEIWNDEGRDLVGKVLEIAQTKNCYQIAQKQRIAMFGNFSQKQYKVKVWLFQYPCQNFKALYSIFQQQHLFIHFAQFKQNLNQTKNWHSKRNDIALICLQPVKVFPTLGRDLSVQYLKICLEFVSMNPRVTFTFKFKFISLQKIKS